jgi:hypothetical protein
LATIFLEVVRCGFSGPPAFPAGRDDRSHGRDVSGLVPGAEYGFLYTTRYSSHTRPQSFSLSTDSCTRGLVFGGSLGGLFSAAIAVIIVLAVDIRDEVSIAKDGIIRDEEVDVHNAFREW